MGSPSSGGRNDVFCLETLYSHVYCLLYDRYRNGIRGHMKAVVLTLLRQYLQHEVLFNEGIIY